MANSKNQKSRPARQRKSTGKAQAEDVEMEAADAVETSEPTESAEEEKSWAENAESAGEQDSHDYGQSSAQADSSEDGDPDERANTGSQEDQVHLQFPYSDMIRAYAPDAMKVADKVATDWKNEGSFMNLGIENPYANMAVSMGLQKAKELEKKLEEKGVMSAVRMGFEVLRQQVNKRK